MNLRGSKYARKRSLRSAQASKSKGRKKLVPFSDCLPCPKKSKKTKASGVFVVKSARNRSKNCPRIGSIKTYAFFLV